VNELALFAGGGGGILAGQLMGWRTRVAVEIDAYARRILLARMRDRSLEPFALWDDVCTFDGKPWRNHIDVVSGGFPCTDIAACGTGKGIEGDKSGLWKEMARILGEVGSPYCFMENSPVLTSRGLGVLLGDLAEMGYDAKWGVLGAHHCGAPHRRDRIWIVGYSHANQRRLEAERKSQYEQQQSQSRRKLDRLCEGGQWNWKEVLAYANDIQGTERRQREIVEGPDRRRGDDEGRGSSDDRSRPLSKTGDCAGAEGTRMQSSWWETEPGMGRVAHGVAHWVDRLKATGNGQVSVCAAHAFKILSKEWR
jgi:DNA (cytosine-5)-methyltransferase 1